MEEISDMHFLSIVIPAYNEEQGIEIILKKLIDVCHSLSNEHQLLNGYEIIVVNDGSSDETHNIVETFSEVRLIDHHNNRGYGAALKTGFEEAHSEYIAFLDADGTYPPEALGDLLAHALSTDADMVVGTRMTGSHSRMPITRWIGNTFYAWVLSWIANRRITDTASGMRIFKRSILKRLEPLPDGLDLTPSMSTLAFQEGLNVLEVPISYNERVGRSKLSVVRDGIRFFHSIVTLAELYEPLKFFGAAGLLMVFGAFILGLEPVSHYIQYREVPDDQIYRLFTIIVLAVIGLNSITFGVSLNYILALIRGRFVRDTWITKILRPSLLVRLDLVGTCLILAAVLLNWKTIYQYVTTAHIWVHWSYILVGAFLSLIGGNMLMIGRLIRIFEKLRERLEAGGSIFGL